MTDDIEGCPTSRAKKYNVSSIGCLLSNKWQALPPGKFWSKTKSFEAKISVIDAKQRNPLDKVLSSGYNMSDSQVTNVMREG